jgi:hypothetical protein
LDTAPNEQGEGAVAGQPNLYYWQEGQGTRFIAGLSEADDLVWGADISSAGFAERISANVSPNGRFLAFTSERSLTGQENRNAEDRPVTEVFLYDSEAQTGRLFCVSCSPSGTAAAGQRLAGQANFPPDPAGLWAKRWVAATLPEASMTETVGRSLYRSRSVLDNGRVYFNSVDPLLPADSNGQWDVYQYQPVGLGSCETDTNGAAAARSGGGCVSLVSSGVSNGNAGFLDATPDGSDVFFLTRGRLSVLDVDNEVDVYDARVNGIPAVLRPIQECAGEACQAAASPPNDPTPASESFRGAETPRNCRKGQRKVKRNGRTVCVTKKKKHKKKRSGKNRRAQR